MDIRDKVIKGLECCAIDGGCGACPYDSFKDCPGSHPTPETLMKDALALLKEQEPRVMTWQEVIGAAIECKPLYVEAKDSEDKDPGDDRWAMVTQYKDSITNGMIRAMSSYITSEIFFKEWYGKTWRCWTSCPTKEQMEAIPWN